MEHTVSNASEFESMMQAVDHPFYDFPDFIVKNPV